MGAVVADFVPWALAGANVGTWRCVLSDGLVHVDAIMADIFGWSESAPQGSVPLAWFGEAIVPEDRHVFDRKNEVVLARGGPVVMEYRIAPRPGVLRWVLFRGLYQHAEDGAVTGHGIAIDITATKLNGHAKDTPFLATVYHAPEADAPLDRIADAAMALYQEVEGEPDAVPGLRTLAEVALTMVGKRYARELAIEPEDP